MSDDLDHIYSVHDIEYQSATFLRWKKGVALL